MENTNTTAGKIFMGFGLLTILCGVYFIVQGDYIGGISGSLVGALLIYLNTKKVG